MAVVGWVDEHGLRLHRLRGPMSRPVTVLRDTFAPSSDDEAGPVLVVDYGAQYAQLIARRVREAHVYSEIVPHTTPVADIVARRPAAVILSGGPASVYADGAPRADPALFSTGIPVLGICYGLPGHGRRPRRSGRAHR